MSRKRKHGERPPSSRLNDNVNALSEGEFEDAMAMLRSGPKKRMFADLVAWQRGRQPYDDFAEKEAFAGYDLVSMRVVANRELDKALAELRYRLPREMAKIADALVTTPRPRLMQLLSEIATAKVLAIKRCYLKRLVKLVELEALILPHICEGDQLESESARISLELAHAETNITLAKEVENYRAGYLEKLNERGNNNGDLDQNLITTYLASDFAKLDIIDCPPLLWSKKCLIDEVFNSLHGNISEARQMTRRVYERDAKEHFLSPTDRAKRLKMAYEQCIMLGDMQGAMEVLRHFEACNPEAPASRSIYLIRYLVILLDYALSCDNHDVYIAAVAIYERNEEFVLQSEVGGNRSRILIVLMLVYLGLQELKKAAAICDELFRAKDQKPPIRYSVAHRVCHLMILFDTQAVDQLQHFARNYRAFFVKKGDYALPALALSTFLVKNCKKAAMARPKHYLIQELNSGIETVVESLKEFETADVLVRRLPYSSIFKWLEAKRCQG
jgi:hypothetical protein